MEPYVLCHKEENTLAIQLAGLCGLVTRSEWEIGNPRRQWNYTEASAETTVFNSFAEAVDAQTWFRIPKHIIPRPVNHLERSTHFVPVMGIPITEQSEPEQAFKNFRAIRRKPRRSRSKTHSRNHRSNLENNLTQ